MALDVRLYIVLVILCDTSLQRRFYYKLDGKPEMVEADFIEAKNITRVVIHVNGWLYIDSLTVTTSDEKPNVFIRHFDGFKEHKLSCDLDEEFLEYDCGWLARYVVVESKSMLENVEISTKSYHMDEYIGCFKNISTSQTKNARSTAVCSDYCKTFYGTNSKGVCFCAESLNELVQVDLSLCDNYDRYYGLSGRDDYFATYWKGLKPIGYSNSPWDCLYELKDCPKCPKGKMGIDCEIIDCSVDNGNCGDSKCQNISVPPYFTFKNCFCTSGFHVGPNKCEDIDECANSSDLCDASSTKCVNSQGSYTCEALREHDKEEEKELEKEHEKEHEKEQDKEQKNGTDQEKDPKAEMILVYTGAGFAALALLCIVILYIYFKKKGPTKE